MEGGEGGWEGEGINYYYPGKSGQSRRAMSRDDEERRQSGAMEMHGSALIRTECSDT